MASVNNYITLLDLKKFQTQINNFFTAQTKSRKMNCQNLLNFCIKFEKLIKQYGAEIIFNNKSKNYNIQRYSTNTTNDSAIRQIMVIGAQLVFLTRTFLLEEEITFLLGGVDNFGNLKTVEQPQNIILNNLYSSLSSNAVLLSSSLEKIENLKQVDKNIEDLWKSVLIYSDLKGIYHTGQDADIVKDEVPYYKKKIKDIDIYIRFAGPDIASYYSADLLYFNRGWLFEWFETIIKNNYIFPEELKNYMNSSDTPLSPIILGMDNIPGYKGGDFSVGNKQYQAKYGNQQVISFSSIATVIKSMRLILEQYKNAMLEDENETTGIAAKLIDLFAENNLERINQGYDKIIDQLLQKLTINN